MSLFGILLIVAILTAIPTYGLSFVALYFAKKWINQNEGRKVAAAAINALNEDKIVTIPFVSAAGIQSFFKTYGTTEKKFDRVGNPTMGYIGYVTIHSSEEFVIMVNGSGTMVHVSSFVPPQQLGNDLISLIAKKQFVDSIVKTMEEGNKANLPKISMATRLPADTTEQLPSFDVKKSMIRRAEAGDSDAQYELAQNYRDGIGVRQSDKLAFKWCLRAAEHKNDDDPMFDVAEMHRLGKGTKRNLDEAFKWYVATIDWAGGYPEAKNRVGMMYRDGQGTSQDYELARDWFVAASTNGNRDAMFNLGIMVASGQGGAIDYNEAMSWILPAADGGHELAQEYAERIKKLNQSAGAVPKDLHAAFDWYVHAAERAHKKVQRQMGL